MQTLVFDPFSGAAGDMITASLIDLGADREVVVRAMASVVTVPEITEVRRQGMRGLQVRTRAPHTARSFGGIMERLQSADVPTAVIERASSIFTRIRDAEEVVHGGSAHFHEVGADDAIADVVGACMALDNLGSDVIATLPVAVGDGMVTGSHGAIPVPAPATLEILKSSGIVIRTTHAGSGELLTPTGAAILAAVCTKTFSALPAGKILATGYGAGKRERDGTPNLLRTVLIENTHQMDDDRVDVLETNTDDVSGEVISAALAEFMAAGARDASAIPCIMKKGRPGFLVRVIAGPADSPRIAALMAGKLGTLGVRCNPMVHRFVARRFVRMVPVPIGGTTAEVPVKFAFIGEECFSVKAEFEEALMIAKTLGIPVRIVTRLAEAQAWKNVQDGNAEV